MLDSFYLTVFKTNELILLHSLLVAKDVGMNGR